MMAKGYEDGFGYLRGVAIDQHLIVRGRQDDLAGVIEKKPGLLGIGLDEPTAIVVKGDRFLVVGRSVVGIYDGHDHDGKPYYFLATGDQFDLRTRRRVTGDFGLRIDVTPVRAAGRARAQARGVRQGRGRRVHPGARRLILGDGPEDLGMGRGRLPGEAVVGLAGRCPGIGRIPGRAGGCRHPVGVHRHDRLGPAGDRDPRRVRRAAGPLAAGRAGPAPRDGITAGHGCGHHLFGTASAAACLALAEPIKAGTLKGTLRFYGCPAEEGGSAKAFMVREHLFDDCDAVLHWHPSSETATGDVSSQARIAAKFRFHGTSAHAAGTPKPADRPWTPSS